MKDTRFWTARTKKDLGARMIAAARKVESDQASYRKRYQHYLRLYGNRQLSDFVGRNWAVGAPSRAVAPSDPNTRLSLNIVRNMVDAAASKLSKGRPSPEHITTDADYSMLRAARMRNKLVQGHFYDGKFWALRDRVNKTAALCGTGVYHTLPRWGKPIYEYVFPGELFIPEEQGLLDYPRVMYRQRLFDKLMLCALFPNSARAIENASSAKSPFGRSTGDTDMVEVWQGWHLPSKPGAGDGMCVAAIEGETLGAEPHTRDRMPFDFMRWSEEPIGIWGTGLAEQLSGLQFEINSILRTIQANIYQGANLKVFIEKGSQVIEAEINNSLRGMVCHYTGTRPEITTNEVFTPQVADHLWNLVQRAYEITGISQLTAQGQIPQNMAGSGRAQLVYKNIESERFVPTIRADEAAVLGVAEQTLDVDRDLLKDDPSLKIMYTGKSWLEEIEVKEALADVGPIQMKCTPASQLPHDYAGRVAFAEYLRGLGWIDEESAKDLADIPDVDAAMQLELAPKRLIDSQIERMLERGEEQTVYPRMNLALAAERGSRAWQHAKLRGYPQERLDLLDAWITNAIDLQSKGTPPPPPPGAAPPQTGPMPATEPGVSLTAA